MRWQESLATELLDRANAVPAVTSARLYGSATTPELLDACSDMDLELVLNAPLAPG